jgi:hypothetical protein
VKSSGSRTAVGSFRQKDCGQSARLHGERGKDRGLGKRVPRISRAGGGDAMAVTRRVLRDRRRGRRRGGRRGRMWALSMTRTLAPDNDRLADYFMGLIVSVADK